MGKWLNGARVRRRSNGGSGYQGIVYMRIPEDQAA